MMQFEIKLNNLVFYGYHGVLDEEKKIGNEFHVSVSITLPYTDMMSEDNLKHTVSYAEIFDIVKNEMQIRRDLLETIAVQIVRKLKNKFPQIFGGRVKIEKLRPPIPEMLGTASVELIF